MNAQLIAQLVEHLAFVSASIIFRYRMWRNLGGRIPAGGRRVGRGRPFSMRRTSTKVPLSRQRFSLSMVFWDVASAWLTAFPAARASARRGAIIESRWHNNVISYRLPRYFGFVENDFL